MLFTNSSLFSVKIANKLSEFRNYLPFVMATKGKIDEQNDIVKAWFDYVNSDEGQAVIKKVGLILPQ